MVSRASLEAQLKKLHYNPLGWGRGEVNQLPDILLEGEEIYELVNGIYEGGFAMLVATDVRMLLVDKKPLNFLTVEDLRFDMISELDYGHRLIGAHVNIASGSKNLQFHSYNQPRLRKLITHVQHCMAEGKKKQVDHQTDQNQHLEQINQQLQEYLVAQHNQQEQLHKQLKKTLKATNAKQVEPDIEPVKPSGRLADYLFAQSLLSRHKKETQAQEAQIIAEPQQALTAATSSIPNVGVVSGQGDTLSPVMADLYAEGMQEIYGSRQLTQNQPVQTEPIGASKLMKQFVDMTPKPLEVNPLRIASAKLPLALRNRKFGSPSLHAHSRSEEVVAQ